MNKESYQWLYKYRLIFISIFIIILYFILSIKPINTIPRVSTEYKTQYLLLIILYWLIAYVIYSLGRFLFLRNHWIFKIIGVISFVYCLYLIVLPVKTYVEIVRLDKEAVYYQHQTDSLRRIGK